jgi:hypothetical protein
VPEYRAYLIGSDGHFLSSVALECVDDTDAMNQAEFAYLGHRAHSARSPAYCSAILGSRSDLVWLAQLCRRVLRIFLKSEQYGTKTQELGEHTGLITGSSRASAGD